jgi:hypothetical protein
MLRRQGEGRDDAQTVNECLSFLPCIQGQQTVWISETDALQEETTFHHPPEAKIRS